MQIEINHISSQGTTLHFEKEAEQFATLKELIANGAFEFITSIKISLDVVPEKDFFRIKGQIMMTLRLDCSRCLVKHNAPLSHSFTLNYSRQILDDIHTPATDGVELTAQQIGMYYFEGEQIDFTDAVQEQVVLAMPYRPLCHEDCKGLCPQCGKDLNKSVCRCDIRGGNNPFAVLKNMKLDS